jgi:hypothetical protein
LKEKVQTFSTFTFIFFDSQPPHGLQSVFMTEPARENEDAETPVLQRKVYKDLFK